MASRVASSKRLLFRYKCCFYIAIVILCFQMILMYNIYNFNKTRTVEFTIANSRRDGKVSDRNINNGNDPPNKNVIHGKNKASNLSVPLMYVPKCHITSKEAMSALSRAKTADCKQKLADTVCLSLEEKLYPKNLPHLCPHKGEHTRGHYFGCYQDSTSKRDLTGHHISYPKTNTPAYCINHCLHAGFKYAGVQFGQECWCGQSFGAVGRLPESQCNSQCPGNKSITCGGYLSARVFSTGISEKIKTDAVLVKNASSLSTPLVRIVFVLTLNGRQVRQVARLLKHIYHRRHFYYIHVDNRQEYMYRELLPLHKKLPNVRFSKKRFATIWGGASLLQAHLYFIKELLEMKDWNWDYYINLSETDYPIKRIDDLVLFLTKYQGYVFLKSHGRDTSKFIQKQGLDQTFYECDNHLWRLGHRSLPNGIRVDGGSDWVGLHRKFCHYLTYKADSLLTGLKQLYKFTLLPAESFFHTVLQNSQFCDKWVDNNLHLTNWRRKQGCKCQYKHIVDWCGCSPNVLKAGDIDRLMAHEKKTIFFARKFEPIVDQEILNNIDMNMFNEKYADIVGFSSYWQNDYHHLDKSTKINDAYMSFYLSFIRRALTILNRFARSCYLKPGKLLETNLLYESDHFHGILIMYQAQLVNQNKSVILETHFHWKQYYSVLQLDEPVGRLQSLEVGTDFDPKELIFRNYGRLVGPYSVLALRHVWGPGPNAFVISVSWIDPANVIAASYDVNVPKSTFIGSHKPMLKTPLLPGVWRVKLMYKYEVVAETSFLVVPLTIYHGRLISSSEAFLSHNGPDGLYAGKDFAEFKDVLQVNSSKEALKVANSNGRKFGKALDDWVDILTTEFWAYQTLCAMEDISKICPEVDICKDTSWSSRSPDPKSEIRGLNKTSGLLS